MSRSTKFLSVVAVLLCLVMARSSYVAISRAEEIEMERSATTRFTGGDEQQGNLAQPTTMRTEHLVDLDGSSLSVWSQNLTYNKGWSLEHPRLAGDFDGDSKDDIVGFGDQNVWVGISNGGAFSLSSWTDQAFTYNKGWSVFQHPRLVGDFDGDGKDDIVGFGDQNVVVGISNGSAFSPGSWTNEEFTYNTGWRVQKHPRLVGDFDGDGKDDIVGFGDQNVWVGISNGSAFSLSSWTNEEFTYNTGWRAEKHPRLVGDFNGDGKDDIVGFGDQNVWVGISNGSAFSLSVWTYQEFTYNKAWRADKHPRLVGDLNGDGKDDIVGFGDQNVWVGVSSGNAFSLSVWTDQEFTYNTGWRVYNHPRLLGDFDGDGKDDVVGFGDQNVWVGISSGNAFSLGVWTDQEFTYNTGWRVNKHPRLLGDFNGGGKADIVGFGDQNVWVGVSTHAVFLPLVRQ